MLATDEEFLANIQERLDLTGTEAQRNKFTKDEVGRLMRIIRDLSTNEKRELLRRLRMTEQQRDLLLEVQSLQRSLDQTE